MVNYQSQLARFPLLLRDSASLTKGKQPLSLGSLTYTQCHTRSACPGTRTGDLGPAGGTHLADYRFSQPSEG